MQIQQQSANTMAAVLSQVVLATFWLAILVLVIGSVIIGAGIVSSLNGGAFKLPMITAWAHDVPTGQLVAALIDTVVFATGLAYICRQLSNILATLAEGDPFVPENAGRLTRIAIALALIEVVGILTILLFGALFDLGTLGQGAPNINATMVGGVIILLILAQVFREGTRLREEEKMTI